MSQPHCPVHRLVYFTVAGLLACTDAVPIPVPPAAGQGAERQALLDVIEHARATYHVPAMAIALVRHDTILAVASGESGTPGRAVTTDSRFMLGSLTKPFTSMLVGALVDQGLLEWRSRVIDVLPELRDSILPAYRNVTLEQLLEHRAGIIPMDSHVGDGIPHFVGTPSEQRLAYTKWLLRRAPTTTPGTAFRYSNGGYSIAGALAERVTGQPLEALFKSLVFSPLGLTTAGFDPPEWSNRSEPAGHVPVLRWPVRWMPDTYSARDRMLNRAAGNLHMSVVDVARFAQVHLRALRGEPTEALTPTPSLATLRSLHKPDGEYAKGWVFEVDGKDSVSWHNGTDGRSKAYVALRPSRDLGIVILMNVGGDRATDAVWAVERAILKSHPPSL